MFLKEEPHDELDGTDDEGCEDELVGSRVALSAPQESQDEQRNARNEHLVPEPVHALHLHLPSRLLRWCMQVKVHANNHDDEGDERKVEVEG